LSLVRYFQAPRWRASLRFQTVLFLNLRVLLWASAVSAYSSGSSDLSIINNRCAANCTFLRRNVYLTSPPAEVYTHPCASSLLSFRNKSRLGFYRRRMDARRKPDWLPMATAAAVSSTGRRDLKGSLQAEDTLMKQTGRRVLSVCIGRI